MHFFIERGHSLRILASDRFGNNLFIRSGFFSIPFLYYLEIQVLTAESYTKKAGNRFVGSITCNRTDP